MIFENMIRIRGYELKKIADFLGSTPEYPENGTEFGDSAESKGNALIVPLQRAKIRNQRFVVFADEYDFEIVGLGNQPGRYIRTWRDRTAGIASPSDMTDDDVGNYVLERCAPLGDSPEARVALCRSFLFSVCYDEEGLHASMRWIGGVKGHILTAPRGERIPGLPMDSLFHMSSANMTLGELHQNVPGIRRKNDRQFFDSLDHAFDQALGQIEGLLKGLKI